MEYIKCERCGQVDKPMDQGTLRFIKNLDDGIMFGAIDIAKIHVKVSNVFLCEDCFKGMPKSIFEYLNEKDKLN